jgi:hypothetical protein
MAPACGIASYSISIAESDYVEAISKYGVDVTNNSFVQSVSCNYDAGARDLDLLVTGNAGRTISIVFATGNNGTNRQYGSLVGYYSCFTSAKNTLAVASINSDNLVRSSFSSMGPTFDGRLKPDVSAPGCAASGGIYSTQPNDSYGNSCGTSMASPAATGNVALVFEKYRDVFGVDLDVNPPLPSTIKAILVQTATDLVDAGSGPNNPDTGVPVFYHEGPDYATGYGLINAEAATDLIAARTVREMRAQALQQRHLVLLVPGGLPELKVTLAWDDLPGNPAESNEVPKLVNDLDLELRDPSGTRHYPWIIPPPPHEPFDGSLTGIDPMTPGDIVPAIRGVDSVNNVEQVQVDSPAGGEWILKVFSTSVSGFQDISLAANVPLDLANLALVCNGMAPPGGRLPLTATLRNLSNLDLSIRADFSVIDCDQTEQVFRTVTGKSLTGTRTVSRGVTVRLPGGLQTDCNLTLRLVITDEDSGEVLAEETCTFQIPG